MKRLFIDFVKSSFGIICTIITFLQFFLGTSTYKELKETYNLQPISDNIKKVSLIIAFLLIFAYNISEYNRKSKGAKISAEKIHLFQHELRNQIFAMRDLNSKSPTMDHITFYRHIKDKCYILCEFIHEYLFNKFNKDFSICIKMIDDASSDGQMNLDKINVFTLCRAGAEHKKRENNEKENHLNDVGMSGQIYVPVKGNSDFYSILSNQKEHIKTTSFACSNLKMIKLLSKFSKSFKYENTTPEFWKYYKSAIVVPIRIEKSFLSTANPKTKNGTYQTMGFLCVDYKKPISKAEKEEIVGYMKSFGDSLYDFFYEISIMDRAIQCNESVII
ncbi:MAG: hypothetical protein UIM24_00460 [Clostridia bacterium]|nr:hypothetical protein [Clostridia bacterium]